MSDIVDDLFYGKVLRRWRQEYNFSAVYAAEQLSEPPSPGEKPKSDSAHQRKISYIETGKQALKADELTRLMKIETFQKVFEAEKGTQIQTALDYFVATRDNFAEFQQSFLSGNDHLHDFWFINAVGIPMFEDQGRLGKTWIRNLQKGINYNLIWDFSAAEFELRTKETWSEQKKILNNIYRELAELENDSTGKIRIYAFRSKLWDDGARILDFLCRDLKLWADLHNHSAKENNWKKLIEIYDVFDLGDTPKDIRYLLHRYCYAGGATLTYIDRRPEYLASLPTVMHLECGETTTPFGFSGPKKFDGVGFNDIRRLHVFFGKPHDSRIAEHIRIFQTWANEKLELLTPETTNL